MAAKASSSEAGVRYSSQTSMRYLSQTKPVARIERSEIRGHIARRTRISLRSMRATARRLELLRRHLVGGDAAGLHNHLDRVLDPVLGVAQRRRQIVEREGVGVDLGGVEPLLPHEGLGAMGRALA